MLPDADALNEGMDIVADPIFNTPVAPFVKAALPEPVRFVVTVNVPLLVMLPATLTDRLGIDTVPLIALDAPLKICVPVLAVKVPLFVKFPPRLIPVPTVSFHVPPEFIVTSPKVFVWFASSNVNVAPFLIVVAPVTEGRVLLNVSVPVETFKVPPIVQVWPEDATVTPPEVLPIVILL